MAYFVPFAPVAPARLIVRKDTIRKLPLNFNGEVMLTELLANRNLRGLFVDKRSYGPALDPLIAHHLASSEASLSLASGIGRNIPHMLIYRRGDYALETNYLLESQFLPGQGGMDDLLSLPIAEQREMDVLNFACPRTAWGREAISRIEGILSTKAVTERIRMAVDVWMSPTAQNYHKSDINAFFSRRRVLTAASAYQ